MCKCATLTVSELALRHCQTPAERKKDSLKVFARNNPEYFRANSRRYYAQHREEILHKAKLRREAACGQGIARGESSTTG